MTPGADHLSARALFVFGASVFGKDPIRFLSVGRMGRALNNADGFEHVQLTLSEFAGFEALLLDPTYDIVFSMSGLFESSTVAVGASFPTYGVTITVTARARLYPSRQQRLS